MAKRLTPIAICYDFDGTLAPGNMQERDFIPALNVSPSDFWNRVKSHSEEHDMDEILAYMQLMLKEAKEKNQKVDKKTFHDFGKKLEFFPGVDEWFGRINKYGKIKKLSIKHYIISSGLREMITGTSIAKYFEYIFASGFQYDVHGVAQWPALAVNYTNKSQYLFRINKGIPNSWDNSKINKYTHQAERPVPFSNMIYLGDGETDIPAMKMITYQGGHAIAVYPPKKPGAKGRAKKLVEVEGRANAAALADFTDGKNLDKLVKATLDHISAKSSFANIHNVSMRQNPPR